MSVEKKTIRSDIPGSHVFLNGNVGYVGSTTNETRRLVVNKDIRLQGQVSSCDYLLIEGVVEAQSFAARRMDILESGLFCGIAEVQDCVIAGRFEGKLAVAGRLTVKSTGQIYGEVDYGTLEVETGAKIDGRLVPVSTPAADTTNVEPIFTDNVYRKAAGQ